jgi:hypothetical protein
MIRNMLKLCIVILTGALLCGCDVGGERSPAVEITKTSMLDFNCASPCWNGIQVGLAEFDEAKLVLQKRYGFDNVKAQLNYLEWETIKDASDGIKRGSILFSSDNIVNDVFLVFDEDSRFLVKDLIETFGEPSWVDISWGGPVQPEKPCFGVALEFPEKGVWADLASSDNSKGVREDQQISMLHIMSPPDSEKWQIYDFVTVKWSGYKDYCQSVLDSMP